LPRAAAPRAIPEAIKLSPRPIAASLSLASTVAPCNVVLNDFLSVVNFNCADFLRARDETVILVRSDSRKIAGVQFGYVNQWVIILVNFDLQPALLNEKRVPLKLMRMERALRIWLNYQPVNLYEWSPKHDFRHPPNLAGSHQPDLFASFVRLTSGRGILGLSIAQSIWQIG
jgi:hypothetical protein